MISRNGSGPQSAEVFFTSAMAAGPMVVVIAITNGDDQRTVVVRRNAQPIASGGDAGYKNAGELLVEPGDEFSVSVEGCCGPSYAWTLEFSLYPQGDVAYEEP